jgi:ABC-2 type transport system permease protein
MNRDLSVARGVFTRSLKGLVKVPPKTLGPLLAPLFFFAAFSGALSGIENTRGFDYYSYTAFVYVFILFMSAMFVGIFTSFDVAGDYETGIGRRLMSAAPHRLSIIAGYLAVGVLRTFFTLLVVTGVVVATGMDIKGSPLDFVALIGLALLLNLATTLYGTGLALRLQTRQAGTLVLIPVFMAIFLTPVFTPRDDLSGWVKTAAGLNPITYAMEAGRSLLAGEPEKVALGFACAVGLVVVFFVFAGLGMRKAEQKG